MNKKFLRFFTGIILIGFFNTSVIASEDPTQAVLQRFDLPNTDYHHCGMSMITYAPGSIKARHEHTGPEVGFVLAGDITIKLEGHADENYHAGESFQIPVNTYHTTEAGPKGAKIIATWMLKN